MKRIKLTIAYDGTNYCGWQIQENGITVEAVINKVLSRITGEKIGVIGASRTDSGVHALGNVAVFDTNSTIPPERFLHPINQRLPEDIVIVKSEEVSLDFHPRYQDTEKTYEYHMINSRTLIPTKRLTHYFVSYHLEIEKMKAAAQYLIGTHDFVSFCNVNTEVEDTVRTIYSVELITNKGEEGEIIVRIRGNGFLYNMVRIIVGTLISVGRGFCDPCEVKEMLEGKERTRGAITAPPHGLVLVEIKYNPNDPEPKEEENQ